MKHHKTGKYFLGFAAALILAVSLLEVISDWSLIERVQYEWRGSGVENWEQEAAEAGIESAVEEYYYEFGDRCGQFLEGLLWGTG